jgi:Fur family ferric uptake transcriptional regulator
MMNDSVGQQVIHLLSSHHFLTVPTMVELLHKQGTSVNKTSVYRALEKLLEQGTVCKQNIKDNDLVYELRTHHHDHVVCTNCGKVATVDCQIDSTTVPGFSIQHHHLTFFGTCDECQVKSDHATS